MSLWLFRADKNEEYKDMYLTDKKHIKFGMILL